MIKTKENQHQEIKDERKLVFDVHRCSMVDPFILATPAFKIIVKHFKSTIQEAPTYTCDVCQKFEFWKNVFKLNALKYRAGIHDKFSTGKSDWIFGGCHKSMLKNKIKKIKTSFVLNLMSLKAYVQLIWCKFHKSYHPHSIVAWMSRNSLLEAQVKSEV